MQLDINEYFLNLNIKKNQGTKGQIMHFRLIA